jgi:hypothetical protein
MQQEIFLEAGIAGASSFTSRNAEEVGTRYVCRCQRVGASTFVHEHFFALSFDDDLDADHGSLLVSIRNEVWGVFRSRSAAEEVLLPEFAERIFREPFREGRGIETLEGRFSLVPFDDDHVVGRELAEEGRRLR